MEKRKQEMCLVYFKKGLHISREIENEIFAFF